MIGFLIWLEKPSWSFPMYSSRLEVSVPLLIPTRYKIFI